MPELFLALSTILFGAFQLFVSFHKLNNLQATMMDLGDFRQEMFQISHGNWWAFDTVFRTPAVAQDGFFLIYPLAYAYGVVLNSVELRDAPGRRFPSSLAL